MRTSVKITNEIPVESSSEQQRELLINRETVCADLEKGIH